MPELQIIWPDGEAQFGPSDSPVRIGRSSQAAVPLVHGSVSRRHLDLTWADGRWQVTDHSTHGTYDLDGRRLPSGWLLEPSQALRLGGVEGVEVSITHDVATRPSSAPGAMAGTAAGSSVLTGAGAKATAGGVFSDATEPPALSPPPALAGPGPSLSDPQPQPTGAQPAIRVVTDNLAADAATLELHVEGHDYSFEPGAEVTVGRDPSCSVRLGEDHSLVSRRHLRITYRDEAWWIEDFSSKGTWIDKRRLKGPYRAQGAFLVSLGDDDAGTPMRVLTAGVHRAPRPVSPWLMGALVAAALVPLAILVGLFLRGGDESPDFDTAKRSTVMLFGREGGQGSGFFVADDLLVTNQHVAALSNQLLVGVSREPDQPARIEYATELVANHPYLDIAVLRISNRAGIGSAGPEISSGPVGEIGLPAMPIGNSADLSIGDQVHSTGFPGDLGITSTNDVGELRLPAVTATTGELTNLLIWPGCSNPDQDTYIPVDSPASVRCADGGDIERGVLMSNFASGRGASGSPVIRHNEVVGVVYAGAPGASNASLDIATASFSEWLADLIATN
jgi:pSer/pThr/pTyr-binding forkhead associated (FHA) protein